MTSEQLSKVKSHTEGRRVVVIPCNPSLAVPLNVYRALENTMFHCKWKNANMAITHTDTTVYTMPTKAKLDDLTQFYVQYSLK
jgi:hypothetical protein